MNIDFDVSDTTAPIAFTPTSYASWDTATWDNSYWGAGNSVSNVWLGITGIGYCGGIQFKTLSSGIEVQWASTDVVYQQGWAGI
jgi:hypothetical protein